MRKQSKHDTRYRQPKKQQQTPKPDLYDKTNEQKGEKNKINEVIPAHDTPQLSTLLRTEGAIASVAMPPVVRANPSLLVTTHGTTTADAAAIIILITGSIEPGIAVIIVPAGVRHITPADRRQGWILF
jgi:hypothetical protein